MVETTKKKFKVEITEILVGEIEVEADSLEEAIKLVQQGHENAGEPKNKLSPLQTEEMTARIMYGKNKEKRIKLI